MDWFRRFMIGRYGFDQLTFAILILYFVLMVLVNIFGVPFVGMLVFLLVVWAFFRMLSRNIGKRRAENEKFLRMFAPIFAWFKNGKVREQTRLEKQRQRAAEQEERKNFCHFKCEKCGQMLRVPRGKGKVKVHCPKCGNDFEAKT